MFVSPGVMGLVAHAKGDSFADECTFDDDRRSVGCDRAVAWANEKGRDCDTDEFPSPWVYPRLFSDFRSIAVV
jgi:hypothetical protein